MVKNPPAKEEVCVQSLDWEGPLEEGVATHSSVLAWRIPMDRGALELNRGMNKVISDGGDMIVGKWNTPMIN